MTTYFEDKVIEYQKEHPDVKLDDKTILAKAGGIRAIGNVWNSDDIKASENDLLLWYSATTISLAIGIFALLEGILKNKKDGAQAKRSAKPKKARSSGGPA